MIRLRILGGLDLADPEGRELRPILAQPKRLALLVYLTLGAPLRYRRRDSVVALFWPELDQEHARGALRQALRFLRRSLGEGVLVARGEEEIGVEPDRLWCDAVAFEAACDAGDAAAAMALYRGDLLEGFFVADAAAEFEQWVENARTRLRRRAAEAAWTLAERQATDGDSATATAWARRAAALAPNDEGELRRQLVLLDRVGDRAGALAAYEAFAAGLRAEYGSSPAPETEDLVRSIREREESRMAQALAPVPTDVGGGPPRPPPGPSRARDGRPRLLVAIAAAGVLAIGGYVAAFRGESHRGARVASIAVVPIEDLEGDPSRAYVAEGLTEELITDLARIRPLRVINRQTMSAYRGKGKTPREVARELAVDAVVTGTMQRLGDTVHLTAQVSLAGEDRALWAESYDGSRGDLLRLQREIARAVVERIGGELTPADRAELGAERAVAPEALDAYIRARHWLNRRGRGNLLKAIDLFNRALDLDPRFAQAYSGVATAYVQLGYGSFLSPADAFPKAAAAARKALELDSALAEPRAVLGFVHLYHDWNWAGADSQFRLALQRNPSDATAHEWYGLFLAAMGRFQQAQLEERQATELDPLSVAAAATAGWVLHYSGKQREAERQLRIALRMDSTFDIARLYLGRVLQFNGDLDSAIGHFEALGPLRQWIPNVAGLGYVYAQQGRVREARAVLARMDSLSPTEYVTPYAVALIHAALGDRDSAFLWLDRSVAERAHWLVWLNRDLRWQPLRADPRFSELVRRVGLPP